MATLEFDDEGSRLVEAFNASAGATARRARILHALALHPGDCVLDVGSGPGHQAFEMASVVGDTGYITSVDAADSAIEIARRRCAALPNVRFQRGEAAHLPCDDATFDAVMSSQVFEYLDDVRRALTEMFRGLKPGGRGLMHDTDWGALLWHASTPDRMMRRMKVWDGHLAAPHLPQTLGRKLTNARCENVRAEAVVQVETTCDPSSVSAILMKFVVEYVVSQGLSQSEADAWADDLRALGASGDYFFSLNAYIFTAAKP
jgi:arsenite methyltransferase